VTTISVGKLYPGYRPDNWLGLNPTIATGQLCLLVVAPQITRDEVQIFNDDAMFVAIREGKMLYLAVDFGHGFGADSSYSIYKDSPVAMSIPLPRMEDIPEGESPWVHCILVDSATGLVRAIRSCVPPGFSRTWLAAIQEQKSTPFNEEEERKWGEKLISQYPSSRSLATHPHAVIARMRAAQERR